MKRAAIYIRVSSERQGEKASPEAQENDSRTYCESKGYAIIGIYKDIERYRVGGRLVEPSGTRADRPELKRMLSDAYDGKLDVIIAWREDRLYRSYRPMLDVLDCIDETGIDIELVKETFDKRIAPVKAWAARMELDAKHDRFIMGVASRLDKGKAWTTHPAYGYERDGDYLVINPEEAQWVEKIFEWHGRGEAVKDMRKWLIAQGAQQRTDNPKTPWNHSRIYKILKYETYWTGVQIVNWNDEEFEIDVPIIVDKDTARACLERRENYKKYPAGNYRKETLAAGLAYCHVCGVRMSVKSNSSGYRRKSDGKMKRYVNYSCVYQYKNGVKDGCAGTVSAKKIDKQIWAKVWELVSIPGTLEDALQARIEDLQSREVDAEAEYQKLQGRLDDVLMERQRVIAWARKQIITEDDLEMQLIGLTIQQTEIENQINEVKMMMGNQADKLRELADLFREQVRTGYEHLNEEPWTTKIAKLQHKIRRKLVKSIVNRVDVFGDKSVKVRFVIDLPSVVESRELVDISTPSANSSNLSKLRNDR